MEFSMNLENFQNERKWLQYYAYTRHDSRGCKEATRLQKIKDDNFRIFLDNQKIIHHNFDNLQILCLGHSEKHLAKIPEKPYLKKINLNDIDVHKYSGNEWAESRAFIAKDLFSQDKEFIGYTTASWNDKFISPGLHNFHIFNYSKNLINSNEKDGVVLCADVHCCCVWPPSIKAGFNDSSLVHKIEKFMGLNFKHAMVPFCNQFIAHRGIVKEYLNYLDKKEIFAKIDEFVKKNVLCNPNPKRVEGRAQGVFMELVNTYWFSKQDYFYIPNAIRTKGWYESINIEKRIEKW